MAEETCDFMVRELRTPEGGLSASLDADSDGAEGVYYVWTPAQLSEILGQDDGAFAARAFGVTETGTFEHGTSVLQRHTDPTSQPAFYAYAPRTGARHAEAPSSDVSGISPDERLDRIRGVLLTAREGRTRPARDDKVVAAWNGMAIGALAEAGVLFGRPDLVAAAERSGRAAGLRCITRRAGSSEPRATGWPGRAPGYWRTTPAWRPGCCGWPG